MKGQTLMIQFALFFLIGLSLFALIGNTFNLQAKVYQKEIAEYSRENIASYINAIIAYENSCKCDLIEYKIELKNTTTGYVTKVILLDGLRIVSLPSNQFHFSKLFNLNTTYQLEGESFSTRPIKITISKTENKIRVI
jgi:hypothetical protein